MQAGGTVIADAAAGLMDEHCAWRRSNTLNELFGIAAPAPGNRTLVRKAGEVSVTEEGARWGLDANKLTGLALAEPDVKAAGGTPLMRIGGTDAVIVRRVGKGWAVYLNTLMDGYSKQRNDRDGGSAARALVNALFERAGVHPAGEVLSADGKRLAHAQLARYRFGDAEVLAVVKDHDAIEGVVGQDGVTVYTDARLGQVAQQEIMVRLPEKRLVTDIRSGKRLGFTDTVRTSIVVGDAVVLGLAPAENKLSLRGPASARLGDQPQFTVSSSLPGRRLTRCHVFSPDGRFLAVYSKNLLSEGGSATFILPSALNDAAGSYTLRATDVITGATAETKITFR
jgi:hypothetical protein